MACLELGRLGQQLLDVARQAHGADGGRVALEAVAVAVHLVGGVLLSKKDTQIPREKEAIHRSSMLRVKKEETHTRNLVKFHLTNVPMLPLVLLFTKRKIGCASFVKGKGRGGPREPKNRKSALTVGN